MPTALRENSVADLTFTHFGPVVPLSPGLGKLRIPRLFYSCSEDILTAGIETMPLQSLELFEQLPRVLPDQVLDLGNSEILEVGQRGGTD